CRLNLVLAEYANSPTSVGIRISESGWNRLSVVSALASVRLSVHLFRSAPESWVLHKGLIEGGGLPDVTPPKPELVSFVEKGGELSPLSMRLVRERERERDPPGIAGRGFYTYRRGGRLYIWPCPCRHLEHGRVVRRAR
ncbi:hypothetical protein B296_00035328, partial [Ensete ventricosum]